MIYYALIVSLINLLLYQFPFYKFVLENFEISQFNSVFFIISLVVAGLVLNALVFYIGLFILRTVGKGIIALFFLISAVAVYFINTYSIIIDRSMIGNVFNTNMEESSSFFSLTLLLYILFLGILPGLLLFQPKIIYPRVKNLLITVFVGLMFLLGLVYLNSSNLRWIDKNSNKLGALVMPWSYVVNSARYYNKISKENETQILLPNATIKDDKKAVVVLVIGESARSDNFSLYGYQRNTNPLLSKMDNVHWFEAQSCATYTTAGVKCILEHENTGKLYEILPNYLYRNNVDVYWRTTNWGEPKVIAHQYTEKKALRDQCKGENCLYDESLLYGLKEQILASDKNKILVVLHTSTSHGPTYFDKHPPEFSIFTPECKDVESSKCSQQELINAYDNTIVYTDYLLASVIKDLKELEKDGYNASMIFVSDHGESLGENNLYMHGLPVSIAPNEQLNIPFIVWTSDSSREVKNLPSAEQHDVFHSVLDFLSMDSPVYDEQKSIFKP